MKFVYWKNEAACYENKKNDQEYNMIINIK